METAYLVGMIICGLLFGWAIGSHYTGAVMGTTFGSKVLTAKQAIVLIAIFVILGSTFESSRVIQTVGTGVVREPLTMFGSMIIVLSAFIVTVVNTYLRFPISTSQLLIFCVVGTGLAMHAGIFWDTTILALFITWIGTPIMGSILGYILTRLIDLLLAKHSSIGSELKIKAAQGSTEKVGVTQEDTAQATVTSQGSERVRGVLRFCLIAIGCYSAYTLGANNTGNAVGVFYGVHLTTPMTAGFVGGIAMAIGALTWGRPILEKVGLSIVQLDLHSGIGAQLAMAITAHTAAFFGYPTSMNQALIGGVAGAGLTRGVKALNAKALREIVVSWVLTPMVGGVVAFILYTVLSRVLGAR